MRNWRTDGIPNPQPPLWLPLSIAVLSMPSAARAAELVRTLDGPLDYMTDAPLQVDGVVSGWADAANAIDGDASTFAVQTALNGARLAFRTTSAMSSQVARRGGLWYVEHDRMRLAPEFGFRHVFYTDFVGAGMGRRELNYNFTPPEDPDVRAVSVFQQIPHVLPDMSLTERMVGRVQVVQDSPYARVYSVQLFIPDIAETPSASVNLARALIRAPASTPARITVHGMQPLASLVTVNAVGGATVTDQHVERVEYSITGDAGARTTVDDFMTRGAAIHTALAVGLPAAIEQALTHAGAAALTAAEIRLIGEQKLAVARNNPLMTETELRALEADYATIETEVAGLQALAQQVAEDAERQGGRVGAALARFESLLGSLDDGQ